MDNRGVRVDLQVPHLHATSGLTASAAPPSDQDLPPLLPITTSPASLTNIDPGRYARVDTQESSKEAGPWRNIYTRTVNAERQSRSRSTGARSSIDSICEDDSAGPQSFVVSHRNEDRVVIPSQVDGPAKEHKDPLSFMSTQILLPSPAFQGWKSFGLRRGKINKSYNDLRPGDTGTKGWSWHEAELQPVTEPKKLQRRQAAIELLPFEILDQILSNLLLDVPPEGWGPRNADLISCLLTSRTVHAATLSILYRNVTIPHPRIFSKMLQHITEYPAIGTLVRRLDFSHYTVVGLGRTRKANQELQYVSPKSLTKCLELMPNLKEFLVHEHIDDELNEDVLRLLFAMPSLRAVDLCACSSQGFVQSMDNAITNNPGLPQSLPNLRRISLHECSTLQAPLFESLLSKLDCLTHLDVSHTLICDDALAAIPSKARLTHLNLSRCTQLSGSAVVEFILTHEAAKDSLRYVNLMADASRHRLLEEDDLRELLPGLPSTLRSLNINGSKLTSALLPFLIPLTKHLEELSISHSALTTQDINCLFVPASTYSSDGEIQDRDTIQNENPSRSPSTLHYLDLTSIPSITRPTLFAPTNLLLTPHSSPLEVIELSDDITSSLRARYAESSSLGWVVRELGRRGWLVRDRSVDSTGQVLNDIDEEEGDDGRRVWKMGARWWGMRKIPVAVADVGGMYGHYMFKS